MFFWMCWVKKEAWRSFSREFALSILIIIPEFLHRTVEFLNFFSVIFVTTLGCYCCWHSEHWGTWGPRPPNRRPQLSPPPLADPGLFLFHQSTYFYSPISFQFQCTWPKVKMCLLTCSTFSNITQPKQEWVLSVHKPEGMISPLLQELRLLANLICSSTEMPVSLFPQSPHFLQSSSKAEFLKWEVTFQLWLQKQNNRLNGRIYQSQAFWLSHKLLFFQENFCFTTVCNSLGRDNLSKNHI